MEADDVPTTTEEPATAGKISTSGARASGREIWKLERGQKIRRTPKTIFGRSKRSRKGRVKP
jgi:hypothetical protein